MGCRTTFTNKFGTRLRFKQYDEILGKEQSVLTKKMSSFAEKIFKRNMFNVIRWTYIFMTVPLQYKLMKIDTVVEILTLK